MTESDEQFLLGMYRSAVKWYQPGIEKRTGVRLGEIEVKDYRQADEDFMRCLEGIRCSWWSRWFRRKTIRDRLHAWREHLAATQAERAQGCMAAYGNKTIYASFSREAGLHEEYFPVAVVHELAHALWETLDGKPLFRRRWTVPGSLREEFQLLTEGYATYAERVWFLDLYPASLQRVVPHLPLDHDSVYFRGLRRIERIVEQFGPEMLVKLPKQWPAVLRRLKQGG